MSGLLSTIQLWIKNPTVTPHASDVISELHKVLEYGATASSTELQSTQAIILGIIRDAWALPSIAQHMDQTAWDAVSPAIASSEIAHAWLATAATQACTAHPPAALALASSTAWTSLLQAGLKASDTAVAVACCTCVRHACAFIAAADQAAAAHASAASLLSAVQTQLDAADEMDSDAAARGVALVCDVAGDYDVYAAELFAAAGLVHQLSNIATGSDPLLSMACVDCISRIGRSNAGAEALMAGQAGIWPALLSLATTPDPLLQPAALSAAGDCARRALATAGVAHHATSSAALESLLTSCTHDDMDSTLAVKVIGDVACCGPAGVAALQGHRAAMLAWEEALSGRAGMDAQLAALHTWARIMSGLHATVTAPSILAGAACIQAGSSMPIATRPDDARLLRGLAAAAQAGRIALPAYSPAEIPGLSQAVSELAAALEAARESPWLAATSALESGVPEKNEAAIAVFMAVAHSPWAWAAHALARTPAWPEALLAKAADMDIAAEVCRTLVQRHGNELPAPVVAVLSRKADRHVGVATAHA